MIAHLSYVLCDGLVPDGQEWQRCGAPGPLGDNADEARRAAYRRGWRRAVAPVTGRLRDLCPDCFELGR